MNIRSGCLVLLIALVATSCSRRAPTPTPTLKVWTYDEMTVGFIQAGSGYEWYDTNTSAFTESARQLGMTLKLSDSQFRPEAQITAFRNYIQDPDVNVIVVNAIEFGPGPKPEGASFLADLARQCFARGRAHAQPHRVAQRDPVAR